MLKRFDLALLAGCVFAILLGSFTDFGAQCADLRDGMVRLHLLANSDSDEDQALKLAVRDALLAETADLFAGITDRAAAEAAAAGNLDLIEGIAAREIAAQGYDYPVKARLVNMYFDTRQYGGTLVAAGRYDAVQVVIGEGEGRNWWCVMFPPMCVPAASEGDDMELEERIVALGTEPSYIPKFAVVELVEGIRERLSGKGEVPVAETGATGAG